MHSDQFELPSFLKNMSGKLLYLSLGSMGSVDVELMLRLTSFLANTEYRVIVSKGLLHNEYELPPNMWGQEFLPQTSILPLVDLFITHGGNNSVTECMYFGKPMIVLPLFGDQRDNGIRVQEKGFGYTFHPYFITKDELLSSIEKLLCDEELNFRLTSISKRIKSSKSLEYGVSRIEDLVNSSKKSLK